MKTYSAKASEIEKKWILMDAENLILGRLLRVVAMRVRDKHKLSFAPHMDCGANMSIITAEKVQMT